ncbi:helix-turn-helix transcriptional regulator, partial [Xanthomonas axonopodis]
CPALGQQRYHQPRTLNPTATQDGGTSGLRKGQGLTQVQLAEALGVSQQAITAYESGQRRVPISLLPLLARTLGVTVEDLIGVPAARSAGKRGPAPKLQQQLERITRLPKAQQRFVMQMIDTVLQQQQASR